MKHKAFTLIELLIVIAIMSIVAGLVIGAVRSRSRQPSGPATKYSTPSGIPTIWKVTIDGHDYLGFIGGGGLCHAESCPCKKL